MNAENWFQLRIVGVTGKTRDSDFRRSPLVRCGKYVSRACTLDLAPVQVRDRVGVLLNRASLEVLSFLKTLEGRRPSNGRAEWSRGSTSSSSPTKSRHSTSHARASEPIHPPTTSPSASAQVDPRPRTVSAAATPRHDPYGRSAHESPRLWRNRRRRPRAATANRAFRECPRRHRGVVEHARDRQRT